MSGLFLDYMFPFWMVVFGVWLIYSMIRGRKSHRVGEDNMVAVRENSELLRELIAINRQLLEKQDRPST